MSFTLTGTWTIQCDTLANFTTMLDDLSGNANISNILDDENLLTITCDVNATG